MALVWEDAGHDGYDDQNASTTLVDHGYWSLGDNHDCKRPWDVELIVQDADLEPVDYLHGAIFDTEEDAKNHAQTIEDKGKVS